MPEHDDFSGFLEGASVPNSPASSPSATPLSGPLFTEVPPSPPPRIERAATGLAPMERIALEGKAYRGLASGSQPWWVIIAGWVILGMPCLLVLMMMASLFPLGGEVAVFSVMGAIALCAVYIWIMYRGTKAKLAQQKEQQQRRAKYRP